MYERTLSQTIERINRNFPVLLLTGPRQVGKTTLLEMCAGEGRNYVSLDEPEARNMAKNDPGLFIRTHKPPLTIDEVQYAPNLFTEIKIVVDREKKKGMYWLTGSQKFHMMRGITESLAGRVGIIDMLGLSQAERDGRAAESEPFMPDPGWIERSRVRVDGPVSPSEVYGRIWRGSFPGVPATGETERKTFYDSYIRTYIQRDVKDILSISDDNAFGQFLVAVAARTGQLLNYADLSRDVGIDNKTAKSWLSILETSGLIHLLRPYWRNVTKRLVTKTPKVYFIDTGLCAYLTRWPDADTLGSGAMSGAILETYLFTEILKSYWHNGKEPPFYYYRDTDQKEIDLIIESGDHLHPVEFKRTGSPSRTATRHFHLLGKLDKKVGHGAVLCFVDRDVPLSREVTAVPVGYL